MGRDETLSRLLGMEVSLFALKRTVGDLVLLARGLRSEGGSNDEYDKALIDLVAEAAGLSLAEDKPALARLMGIQRVL